MNDVEKMVRAYIENGYVLRVPGGMSSSGDYSAYCIVPDEDDEHLPILLVPYNVNKEIDIDTRVEDDDVESPKNTARWKTVKQTGVIVHELNELQSPRPYRDNRAGHEGDTHYKYLFSAATYDASNLRKEEHSNSRVGRSLFVSLNLAEECVYEKHKWMIQCYKRSLIES